MYNKSTAFTKAERERFALDGLLPEHVFTFEVQTRRAYEHITRKHEALERYIGMISLQDRNEVLFYRVLLDHLEELLPIVYTPTVGEACRRFSHIFRRGRGLWITPEDRGRIDKVLANAPYTDVRLIVVTDNERILGLGDLGAGGIGIPIGKLSLYTAGAGIHPSQTLPISLDVGTDNDDLLNDPMYIGWRQHRLRGDDYASLVEEFVSAVAKRFPDALLQWEDFKKSNAFDLLDRYRDKILSFNDDIQSTAAVVLTGLMAASRAIDTPLAQQRAVILGAGAAGIGIARQLRDALARAGVEGEARTAAIAMLDSHGLLIQGRGEMDRYQTEFAWPPELVRREGLDPEQEPDFKTTMRALKPNILIGVSGQGGIFTEDIVREMAAAVERPIIFPCSNPTDNSEARPADLLRWTDGRAVIATGSPFEPVEFQGRTWHIAQGNNVYIFPGVGLGALVARTSTITDALFTAAAESLATQLDERQLKAGALYPPLKDLRPLSAKIALAVAKQAVQDGIAPDADEAELNRRIEDTMWMPAYPEMKAV
jgi:malic enzyme